MDAFADITPDSLLHNIQLDILDLENRAVAGITAEEFARSDKKRKLILTIVVSRSTFVTAHSVKLKFFMTACWPCCRTTQP